MTKYIFVNFINTWCIISAILKMEQTCREFDVRNGKTSHHGERTEFSKVCGQFTHCLLRHYTQHAWLLIN